jgi:putative membrane protein
LNNYFNQSKNIMKITKTLAALATGAIVYSVILAAPANAQKNPQLTDPEIASVAVTANQIDINYAAIAKEKSKDKDILEFANTMSNDHKAVIDKAVALVTKLKVTPKDNAVSQSLNAGAEKEKNELRAKSGKAFDKAYIDNEVAYHKAVIGAVETILIPQAKNAELKALLQSVDPVLKAHLEHAEMVQKNFK